MAFDLRDCTFFGPALPEPFVKFQLEAELAKRKLIPKPSDEDGRSLQDRWEVYRRKLRALGESGGDRRVANHVLEPLSERLGYERFEAQPEVITREGPESGGWLFTAPDGRELRAWSVGLGEDLDAPSRRGRAYRFSPARVAQRVLLASGERVGLLTDGEELRLLLCDPARPDSHVAVRLDRAGGWRAARVVPDSYRLLLALASPDGLDALPDLADAARLAQSTVTKKLRLQARRAIEGFVQELLDHPGNAGIHAEWEDPAELARALWREGLILVYRLLFVFKLESSADPARAFSFAATSLWRNTYSPNTALAGMVRRVLDDGADSGGFLEGGLRALWRMFAEGLSSSELEIKPLGGMLFGQAATPLLDRMQWGERGVARLLDALLWTPGDSRTERERVHYGALDVEDLGRVYEALLELEPGITTEPMCRLRRAKLEVVVPVAQGALYRADSGAAVPEDEDEAEDEGADEQGDEDDESPSRRGRGAAGAKTKVQFIEEIPAERFFLRVGLGRKSTGSYYTPHPFVRFLVQETLGPQLTERSPKEDPQPGKILALKVLDSAMGSGHFLVEACRYLGDALYEACRLCDELAVHAEEQAEKATEAVREGLLAHAAELRKRVEDLPDPEDELVAYLPSRAAEGEESGLSQKKAEALCRRLVAVRCLYGVDKNPLAVELAKLSLWLESYAEGLPLTFMDHRLICGDSLTGPFLDHLLTFPKSGRKLDDLFAQGLTERLQATLAGALAQVYDLEASIGKDLADLEHKRAAKEKLDAALAPLKTLAAAWSGGVMLGDECDDAGYQALAQAVAEGGDRLDLLAARPRVREMVEVGAEGVAFELAFPEVFAGDDERRGFDTVLGNPPWEVPAVGRVEFVSAFDIGVARGQGFTTDGKLATALETPAIASALEEAERQISQSKRCIERVAGTSVGLSELSAAFLARMLTVSRSSVGVVMPGSLRRNKTQAWLRKRLVEPTDGAPRLSVLAGFINKKRLFADLPPVLQYDLVLACPHDRPSVQVAFGLDNAAPLFETPLPIAYPVDAIRRLNPGLFVIAEVNSSKTAQALSDILVGGSCRASEMFGDTGISLNQEINQRSFMSYCTDISSFPDPRLPEIAAGLNARGIVPLLESKSIYQFNANWMGTQSSSWNPIPQYGFPLLQAEQDAVRKSAQVAERAVFFRMCLRETCGSPHTNDRSGVAALVPPGMSAFHSAMIERKPAQVGNAVRMTCLAIVNSFVLDFVARLQIGAHFSLFILTALPWPAVSGSVRSLLVHSTLRLTCNHAGYAPLWDEQLGNAWREQTSKHTWPVLADDDARWAVRTAIDAVVADAYALDRAQYAHVLSTFNHKSYPKAPELCLSALDELKNIGLEAFTRKHDPYWDIPINNALPKPVIELSGLGLEAELMTIEREDTPAEVAWESTTDSGLSKPHMHPTDTSAILLSYALAEHDRVGKNATLGAVKCEKLLHMAESYLEVDLGRAPVRLAAGPADVPHLKKVFHRAERRWTAFRAVPRQGRDGASLTPQLGLAGAAARLDEALGEKADKARELVRLFLLMDTERAEIVATLYACWNDLLARGARPDDAAIIAEFHSWAEGKRRFDTDRLAAALSWMREHDLVPTGRATPTRLPGDKARKDVGSRRAGMRMEGSGYEVVLALLKERGIICSQDAQQATGLDAAGVRPYLNRLVDEGLAVIEGQRRGMKYRRIDG